MALSSELRRKLKAKAHALSAVVQTGSKGITDAVVAETEIAIEHHELIKVRLVGSERDERAAMAAKLAAAVRADIVGTIGMVVILYRRSKPKKAAGPALTPGRKSASAGKPQSGDRPWSRPGAGAARGKR